MTLLREEASAEAPPASPVSSTAPADGRMARLLAVQKIQAADFIADLVRMRGLMPLLMKHRNGQLWTTDEKAELVMQFRILSRVSPYLLFLLLPGSALLLPGYAWWLDRRRRPRSKIKGSKRVAPSPEA